jgi:hypothetical protein
MYPLKKKTEYGTPADVSTGFTAVNVKISVTTGASGRNRTHQMPRSVPRAFRITISLARKPKNAR